MSLNISLSGSLLFKKSAFSFPYCKKVLISSLITFLFRNNTVAEGAQPTQLSSTFSARLQHIKWNTSLKWQETRETKTAWQGKNTFTGDFPVEIRLNSRRPGGYSQGVTGYPFMKVNCTANQPNMFEVEDI